MTSDSVRLYYRVIGTGPDTIVVIHGGPGGSLEEIAAGFAPLAEHHVIVFYDQRGGGRSTLPADPARLAAGYHVADLDQVRRRFELKTMQLVGHSYGALLATSYAIAHPSAVASLVILAGVGPTRARLWERMDSLTAVRLGPDRSARLKEAKRRMVDPEIDAVQACREFISLALPVRLADPERMIPRLAPHFCTADSAVIRYSFSVAGPTILASFGDWDLRDRLHTLQAPTLVLHGTEDVIPMDIAQEWVAALPNARLVQVPAAGHFPFAERPDFVWPVVEQFLARQRYAASTTTIASLARHIGTVKGLRTPESARWDPDLGVWFVSNIDGGGAAKDNNGYISRLKADGTTDSLKFVAGGRNGVTLHAPKGLAIVGDTLWVADIDVVRGFNRRTGAAVAGISVPGARMLNDIAVAPGGIYVTDTGVEVGTDGKITHPGPDRVFRIAGRRVTTAVTFSGHPGPNGITWDSVASRFLVVPYFDSIIVTWSRGERSPKHFTRGLGLMDGVEPLGGGRFLVTAGSDSSLDVVEKGRVTRVAGALPNPGDLGFDRVHRRVAVPLVTENRLELFELDAEGE